MHSTHCIRFPLRVSISNSALCSGDSQSLTALVCNSDVVFTFAPFVEPPPSNLRVVVETCFAMRFARGGETRPSSVLERFRGGAMVTVENGLIRVLKGRYRRDLNTEFKFIGNSARQIFPETVNFRSRC